MMCSMPVVDSHDVFDAGGGFVGFFVELDSVGFEMFLDGADVHKFFEILGITVPTRIKSEPVSFKHSLEKSDNGGSVFQDDPVLIKVSAFVCETQFFRKILLLCECL